MFLLLILLWYFIGITSFIFWWTSQYSFKTSELPLCLLVGLVGPLAFILGFMIHGGHSNHILINKRINDE